MDKELLTKETVAIAGILRYALSKKLGRKSGLGTSCR